uniref:rRNA-processing protein EFG1 n=1 Tax=Brassica campestris TaxID=3711 RepID=M4EY03_BRACM
MAHGGYAKRRVSGPNQAAGSSTRRSKALRVEKKKPKIVSLKNQMRSVERFLRKDLPAEVKETLKQKLEYLKKQQDDHTRLAVERKIFLRNRKIRFFERRKIERSIRRLEKLQRTSSAHVGDADIAEQLSKLKEDLEYVRFFPKNEKYVSLFTGAEDSEVIERRSKMRKQIKANIIVAAASGKELEETGSEDDGLLDLSDDDFFDKGSSSDEADADDELTDKSTKEAASSRATSGMSSDERNQKQNSARALMPPPQARFGSNSRKNSSMQRNEMPSSSRNTSNRRSESSYNARAAAATSYGARAAASTSYNARDAAATSYSSQSSNLSSNSDAHKPKRKRRPKKKKQQVGSSLCCFCRSDRFLSFSKHTLDSSLAAAVSLWDLMHIDLVWSWNAER